MDVIWRYFRRFGCGCGDKRDNRQDFGHAAANDGMVRYFRNGTLAIPYDLKLSYIRRIYGT